MFIEDFKQPSTLPILTNFNANGFAPTGNILAEWRQFHLGFIVRLILLLPLIPDTLQQNTGRLIVKIRWHDRQKHQSGQTVDVSRHIKIVSPDRDLSFFHFEYSEAGQLDRFSSCYGPVDPLYHDDIISS